MSEITTSILREIVNEKTAASILWNSNPATEDSAMWRPKTMEIEAKAVERTMRENMAMPMMVAKL